MNTFGPHALMGWLLVGCRAAAGPPAPVLAAPAAPALAAPAAPAVKESPAVASPPVVYRSEFVASAFDTKEVLLQRATTQFRGATVAASLIHVPAVGTRYWGALLLALGDRPGETTPLSWFFVGDAATARLELRELHGELYAQVHFEEPEPGGVQEVWFLHRIVAGSPPRQVLFESIWLNRGRCKRFETAELVASGGGRIDIVVRGRRVRAPADATTSP